MKQRIYTPKRKPTKKWADQRKTPLWKVILAILGLFAGAYVGGQIAGYIDFWRRPQPSHYITPVESLKDVKVYDGKLQPGEWEAAEARGEILRGNRIVTPVYAAEEPVGESDVHQIIKDAADKYGVSYKLMKQIAFCESGFNPKAANKRSSARGLYQFTAGTWAGVPAKRAPGYRKLMGLSNDLDLRFDPVESANTAAYAIANGGLSNWEADPASYNCWKVAL